MTYVYISDHPSAFYLDIAADCWSLENSTSKSVSCRIDEGVISSPDLRAVVLLDLQLLVCARDHPLGHDRLLPLPQDLHVKLGQSEVTGTDSPRTARKVLSQS